MAAGAPLIDNHMSTGENPPLMGETAIEPKAPTLPSPTPLEAQAYVKDAAIDISVVMTDPIRDALANIYTRIQGNQLAKQQKLNQLQTSEAVA